jgi:hypothetical protein
MVKCPFCQFGNEDGALFCEQCKSDLSGVEPMVAEPAIPVAAVASAETIPLASVEPIPFASTIPDAPYADAIPMAEAMPVAEVLPVAEHVAEIVPVEEPIPLAEEPPAPAPAAAVPASPQPPAAPPAAPAAPAAGPLPAGAQPKLVVLRGQRPNVEYPVYEGHNFIGRSDEKPVDIDLEDQEPPDRVWSSRQHALITFEENALVVEDLNSSNGTFVNRNRIYPGQKTPLKVNDVIQIGTVQMKVKI